MKKDIHITINSHEMDIESGTTILEAARRKGIIIPTLCHHEDLGIAGNCRMCLVEMEGQPLLQPACATIVKEGMSIRTNSSRVRKARKTVLSLLLSEHDNDCLRCSKNGNCELQDLAIEYGVEATEYIHLKQSCDTDISSPAIVKDDAKCIRCQRCVRTCSELQSVNALAVVNKGGELKISTFMNKPLHYVICTNCGQCVNRCPTGALTEKSYISDVWKVLDDPTRHVVVQTAPAVRIALGEALGRPPGERDTGRMVASLRALGFDRVFDTNFTADLTILEEGTELLMRLRHEITGEGEDHGPLPQFSSCSPGWIKFLEHSHPELIGHLSSCKSPQQMFGAIAKTYYAQKEHIDPASITVVSIMPCTAKKFEAQRPEMYDSGFRDVDLVLTTRELGHMLKEAGIVFAELEEDRCDSLLGTHTGAAVLFGATGGVMEAALRTVWEIVTGREIPFEDLKVNPVRGMEGIRRASLRIEGCLPEWSFLEGVELKVGVVHGLANASRLLENMKGGISDFHFIEIMACPGGCLGGGGQPIQTTPEIRAKRMEAIYAEDVSLAVRKSHENPEVKRLYDEFLEEPCGEKSHQLLHTAYTKREKY